MCGIAGYFSKQPEHRLKEYLLKAVNTLSQRGPDLQQVKVLSPQVGLAHARLSIIDTSAIANQPMTDDTGRYTIVFNGEIFNYRELKKQFLADVSFHSSSDTEVLLHLYIRMGHGCLKHLNGFFAFAVFDKQKQEIFIARDRYGIKPLHVYSDDTMIVFGSELKAILQFPVKKELDLYTLAEYLQLNYIPGNRSMLKQVQKLSPGSFMTITNKGETKTEQYYTIPYQIGKTISASSMTHGAATATLRNLIEDAVACRLVSDVPLGSFLSGGVDSSIVSYCAAKQVPQLNTFSIGYKDEPYFDETKFANLVAKKIGAHHTVFSVSNEDMFANIFSILDYTDEPFADSSAIAVYILSQKTKKEVTVALSGDGGDELFAGYNKHRAEFRARQHNIFNFLLKAGLPVFNVLPKSRHSKFGNLFRQLQRYSEGLHLSEGERYWQWCSFVSQDKALTLLKHSSTLLGSEMENRKKFVLQALQAAGDINDVLWADTKMVLPNDMLTKVDLMSMANSLEVRVPLLDYRVVDFAFSLPANFKIDAANGKKILKDAFKNDLPPEIFNRPKHGFEVPLLKWLQTGLRSLLEDNLLERNFVEQQNIFNASEIEKLKQKLFSNNPGDVHATLWGLVVFQYWYKKYFV